MVDTLADSTDVLRHNDFREGQLTPGSIAGELHTPAPHRAPQQARSTTNSEVSQASREHPFRRSGCPSRVQRRGVCP